MKESAYPVVDANINRVSEGLRVVEEYVRFIKHDRALTKALSQMRHAVNASEIQKTQHLSARSTQRDMRAKEPPARRKNIEQVIVANFKRILEGLRVLEEYTGNPLYNQLRYDCYELEKEIVLHHLKPVINPGIYLISDQAEILLQGLKQGVSLIQLRDKVSSKETILNKAAAIKTEAKKAKTPFIINDFLDIALLIDSDGFHSGQDDLPISQIRTVFGPHKIIGRTTHNLAQGKKAQADGADYVSVGPIFETPSKPGRKAIGFTYLKQAAKQLKIPFVAIGGINLPTLQEILTYKPPLLGIIRAHKEVIQIKKKLK